MPNTSINPSVGIVTSQSQHFDSALKLDCGETLDQFDIVFETYGSLNADKSNAILICHALSGDHHAAGRHKPSDKKPGWWDNIIGPGKPLDTDRFYIVSLNNLGGCGGSTGPASTNPDTGKPYGPAFPSITVNDWVNSQYRLMQSLNIRCWLAVIGGSLGGMQALQWSKSYPDKLQHAVLIATTAKLSAQNIAFNEIARQAIITDPDFHDGHYADKNTLPRRGLMIARMLGHITYQSDEAMGNKFGRELYQDEHQQARDKVFQVERYLRHQGQAFVDHFDANTYLLMTKTLDYFDPARDYADNLSMALKDVQCKFLVISFTSDWRFSPHRSMEIVKALLDNNKDVSYAKIDALQGHDAFLLENKNYFNVVSSYLLRALH